MKTKDGGKKSFGKRLFAFQEKHPKFRKYTDIFYDVFDKATIILVIFTFLLVLFTMIIVYLCLPEDIRKETAALVGGLMSLVVSPLIINHINLRAKNDYRLFEVNKDLYIELSDILIHLLSADSNSFHVYVDKLGKFICKNYSMMCVMLSMDVIWDITSLYKECLYEHNEENIKYYAQKYFRKVNKKAGHKAKFYLSIEVLNIISQDRSTD